MTKFDKSKFAYSNGYLMYDLPEKTAFVARFKHRNPVTKARFVKTLIKHYTVEEYFSRLGGAYNPKGEAPLQILMNDNILVIDTEARKFILDGKVL